MSNPFKKLKLWILKQVGQCCFISPTTYNFRVVLFVEKYRLKSEFFMQKFMLNLKNIEIILVTFINIIILHNTLFRTFIKIDINKEVEYIT